MRGFRLQGVQQSRAQSNARRVQKDDLSGGKRRKVRSWIFLVPPLSKQKRTLWQVALARKLEGGTNWEDPDRKDKSALMKTMFLCVFLASGKSEKKARIEN